MCTICLSHYLQVAVGIKALPQLLRSDQYICVFGVNGTVVPGVVSPNEVRCKAPAMFALLRNSGICRLMFQIARIAAVDVLCNVLCDLLCIADPQKWWIVQIVSSFRRRNICWVVF